MNKYKFSATFNLQLESIPRSPCLIDDELLTFTVSSSDYVMISSQNVTDDAAWDTYLMVYNDCANVGVEDYLDINDNAYGI